VVLEIPRNEPNELSHEEAEFLEAMKRLQANPLFQKLADAVAEERERYINNLARTFALTGGEHAEPVNQRVIDYKRGFWNGALWAVTQFPRKKAKGWDKYLAENKESDDA
jgi:hypothetical protein